MNKDKIEVSVDIKEFIGELLGEAHPIFRGLKKQEYVYFDDSKNEIMLSNYFIIVKENIVRLGEL